MSGSAIQQPLKGITPGQLRALAAIAARRGWDRATLREVAGVQKSLKELSVSQASAAIDRLQTSDHRTDYEPPPPDRAARGAIKLASERQRTRIQALIEELGWPTESARHWLAERHRIRDLARGVFSSAAASAAITQLGEALKKRAGIDRGPAG